MESMNISLPDPLKKFVDSQVSDGRYSSASEYIRELIRADEKARALNKLEALLLEGLKGEPVEATPKSWAKLKKEARALAKTRRKQRT